MLHPERRTADFAVNHPERELVRDFPESVDADFDADRLRQAILNLLNNAGAYAPAKTPILTRIAREPDALSRRRKRKRP